MSAHANAPERTHLALARLILAQREAGDPELVGRGRLSPAAAANRLRIAHALVAQWTAIVEHHDVDVDRPLELLGAAWIEIRRDLDTAARRAAEAAARSPDDATAREYADALAAIAAHQQPPEGEAWEPRVLVYHQANQRIRAERMLERKAA